MDYYLDNTKYADGLGDFIVKLPCIYHYSENPNDRLYLKLQDKFKCLLPKRNNIFFGIKGQEIVPDLSNHNYHPTGGWLPKISKYNGNFFRKESFVYPCIEYNDELAQKLLIKHNLNNKKFITLSKISSDVNRNWKETGWIELVQKLNKDFICIDVGSKKSHRNSASYQNIENLINIGDDLNLYELALIIKNSECFIGLDSGFFHLSTAVKCRKNVVIQMNNDNGWFYPNTIVIDGKKNNEIVIKEILEKVYNNI